jgi:hypothetical protein
MRLSVISLPDGGFLGGLDSKWQRLYNWHRVAQYHLNMAKLTGSNDSLMKFVTNITHM